jgi:hypothetical protein
MAKRKAKPKKPAPKKRPKVQATNMIKLDPQIRIEMDYAPCVYADTIMATLCIDPDEKFPDSMGISRQAGEIVNQMILSAVQDCMAATLEWARSAN